MKKLLLIVVLLSGLSTLTYGIDARKVPAAVIHSMHKNFPSVTQTKWEREGSNYEATFRLNGQKTSAIFDKSGAVLETEKRIAKNALLPETMTYIEKNCGGKLVQEASVIKKANGETSYEVKVQGVEYLFDATGKFIQVVKED